MFEKKSVFSILIAGLVLFMGCESKQVPKPPPSDQIDEKTPIIPSGQLGKKTLTIQNRSVVDAYCAYAYLIDAEDAAKTGDYAGYHVRGWVHIPSGHAEIINYDSNYAPLYHCIILTDGRKWENKDIPTASFGVPTDFTERSFQIVYELLPDLRLGKIRYASVSKNGLMPRVFYKSDLGMKGTSTIVSIPGPVEIQVENSLSLPP